MKKPLHIAGILDAELSAGGGFNQALNALIQMNALCRAKHRFSIVTSHRTNLRLLAEVGLQAEYMPRTRIDAVFAALSTSPAVRLLGARGRIRSPFERKLHRLGVDLVYFASPTNQVTLLQEINFIATVWDLSHRDSPEFPEVRPANGFYARERFYHQCLTAACLVLTDSELLSQRISARYGLDSERLLSMPFSPTPFLSAECTSSEAVRLKYGLKTGYFLYPAQFWPHKNHIVILLALAAQMARGVRNEVVFVGGDKGNMGYVSSQIATLGVGDRCRVLGFVPTADIKGLYEGAAAVIMPSYFGPTNLPPLEAWALSRPLICADTMREFVRDAALVFPAGDFQALDLQMGAIRAPETTLRLTNAGTRRLQDISRQRSAAEAKLASYLDEFAQIRACWN